MRYRSIHTLDASPFLNARSISDLFRFAAPVDTTVKVIRKNRGFQATVEFSAASDELAKQQAAAFRTEAAIVGPSDHLGTQVRTRQGWRDI